MDIISGFTAGDDYTVRRNVVGLPSTITISKAWFTVKRTKSDPDSSIFQKEVTAVETAAGEIEDIGNGGTAVLRFDLSPANTLLLAELVTYFYDIQVKLSNNKLSTPEEGLIRVKAGVTLDDA